MGSLFFTGGMQYHYSDKYFPYSGIWLYGVCLGARAVVRGRQINPDFHFGTMICHITRYPRTCHPEDVLLVLKNDLFYNNTCADVMLKGEYPFYALTEFCLLYTSRCV